MIPTEEEKQRIQEAQLVNPDIPLGSAEQFLLTLSSITELSARLQLWAFKMDYELIEKVRYVTVRLTWGVKVYTFQNLILWTLCCKYQNPTM